MAIPEPAVAPSMMAAVAAQAVATIVATAVRRGLGTGSERDRTKIAAAPSVDTTAIHTYRISLPVVRSRILAKVKGTTASSAPSTFTMKPLQ
jgi:hypothetical protein